MSLQAFNIRERIKAVDELMTQGCHVQIMCSKLQQPHGLFFIRQSPPSAPSHYDLLVITPGSAA